MTAREGAPSSILRSGLIYILANASAAAVPFLLMPILTRALTVEEYGKTINFFSLVSICGATAGLSLHAAIGVRWFGRENEDFPSFLSSCLAIIFVSTAVTACSVAFVIGIVGIDLGLSSGWIVSAAVMAGANTLVNSRLGLWQSQGKALQSAIMQVTNSVLAMSLSIVCVVGWKMEGAGRMAGALAATGIVALTAVCLLRKESTPRSRVNGPQIRSALRFGLPLIPHTLAGVAMTTTDRLLVGAMLGAAALGTYGVAVQLGMAMTLVGDAFVRLYGPWLYQRLKRKTERDRYAIVGATWLCVPVFLTIGLIAGIAMQLLWPFLVGDHFRSGSTIIWWFLLGGSFNCMYLSVAGFFFFSSRTEFVSLVTITSAVAGALIGYALIRTLGAVGGGMAYAATQGIAYVIAISISLSMNRDLPWSKPRTAITVAIEELT